jgi:hypothetical protein
MIACLIPDLERWRLGQPRKIPWPSNRCRYPGDAGGPYLVLQRPYKTMARYGNNRHLEMTQSSTASADKRIEST